MFDKVRTIAQAALALAGAAFFVAATIVVLTTPKILLHVDGTLTRLEAVESKAYATAQNLDKASAAWSDSAKRQAADLDTLTKQATQTITTTNTTLAQAQASMVSLNMQTSQIAPLLMSARQATDRLGPAIDAIQGTATASTATIAAIQVTLRDIDTRVSDPHITTLLANMDATSSNAAKMSADAQTKFHNLLYPAPCTGHWCWALKSWTVLKAGSSLMEPGYFLEQAIKNH